MKRVVVASVLVLADLALLSCKGPGTPAEQVDALLAPWSLGRRKRPFSPSPPNGARVSNLE